MKRLGLVLLATLASGEAGFAQAARPVLEPASRTPFVSDCRCGLGGKPSPFEPSGLVWDGADTLYAVSDSGQIVRRALSAEGQPWSCLYVWCGDAKADPRAKAEHDFESVAFVPGAGFAKFLWIGVEGGEYSEKTGAGEKKKQELLPRIQKFDLEQKKFVDAYWNLGGRGGVGIGKGSGVESMTFVPFPQAGAAKTPGGQNLGGHFLVSSQHGEGGEGAGRVYAYDLDAPSQGDPASGESVLAPARPSFFLPRAGGGERREISSDFYYHPGSCTLYVSYDDESDVMQLGPDGRATVVPGRQSIAIYAAEAAGKFVLKQEYSLPAGRGLEAVTAVAQGPDRVALYTAVDMSGGQNLGEFSAAANAERAFAKKKDLKAAKGQLAPNTLDRYPPIPRAAGCATP